MFAPVHHTPKRKAYQTAPCVRVSFSGRLGPQYASLGSIGAVTLACMDPEREVCDMAFRRQECLLREIFSVSPI